MLKLIFLNIKKLCRESTSMFLFILIGTICACFGIFFYSGYFIYNHFALTSNYEIEATVPESVQPEALQAIIQKLIEEPGLQCIRLSDKMNDPSKPSVFGMYYKDLKKRLICGEQYAPDDPEADAMLTDSKVSQLGFQSNIVGQTVETELGNFRITGLFVDVNGIYVSPMYYITHYPVREISAEFDSAVSEAGMQALQNAPFDISMQNNSSPFRSAMFWSGFLTCVLILCIAFLNIMTMFSFWEIKMRQTFRVYYIYGCTRMQKFVISFGEIFLISVSGLLVALGLFAALYRKLGALTIVYADSFREYLIMLLFVLAIITGLSVYFGLRSACRQQELFTEKGGQI